MDSDKIINEQNAHAALQSAEIDELKRVLNLARLSAASATPLSAPGDLMQQLAELQQAKVRERPRGETLTSGETPFVARPS